MRPLAFSKSLDVVWELEAFSKLENIVSCEKLHLLHQILGLLISH